MRRLRISAISYLNTAPLMWDFEHGESRERLKEQFDITYTIPSACAEALDTGAADIGIIPVAAYATIPGLAILPGVAIASLNAVRSILLAKWLGGPREYRSMAPDLEAMLASCEAARLIGDPALLIRRTSFPTVIDLAEEWRKHTGKPFVFAFWAVREKALAEVGAVARATPDAIS